MQSPLPLRRTLAWIDDVVGKGPRRLLEVGCGDGALALALQSSGRDVVALDADRGAVAAARERGVDARLARFPDFEDSVGFDAILFTRSLHHVGDLTEAIARSEALLRPSGRLVLEDWAWDEVDAATVRWMNDQARRHARGQGWFEDWDLDGTLEDWLHEHRHHGLHGRAAMTRAVEARFRIESEGTEPYFYRYVAEQPATPEQSLRATEEVFAREQASIDAGEIKALGWRLSARNNLP